jgi:hypothetical protein
VNGNAEMPTSQVVRPADARFLPCFPVRYQTFSVSAAMPHRRYSGRSWLVTALSMVP